MNGAAQPARPPKKNNSSLSNTRNRIPTDKFESNNAFSKTYSVPIDTHSHDQNSSSLLNDPSLILMRNRFFEAGLEADFDFSMIETSILERFNRHLREYKQNSALSHNYDEAKSAADLSKIISQEVQKRNYAKYYSSERKSPLSSKATSIRNSRCDSLRKYDFSISSETESHEFESQIPSHISSEAGSPGNSGNLSLYNIEEVQDIYLNHFNEETEEKRADLLKLQEQQVERFEHLWSTQMPAKYRKPSARLLELKEKEKALALARDYDEAEIIHKEAEQLMQKEVNEAQQRLINDYRNAREQLMLKQKKEMDLFDEKRRDKRNLLMVKLNEKKETEERREQVMSQQQMTTMKLAEDLQIDLSDPIMNENYDETKSTKSVNFEPRPTTATMMSMAYRNSQTGNGKRPTNSRNSSSRQTASRGSPTRLLGKSKACPVQHKRKVVITFEDVSESQNETKDGNAESNIETEKDGNQSKSNDNSENQNEIAKEKDQNEGTPIEEVNEEEEEKEKEKKCKCILI